MEDLLTVEISFQSLVAKLRSEVQWHGYLLKTGSNMKGSCMLYTCVWFVVIVGRGDFLTYLISS